MESNNILICRLCFEICKSDFEVIEDSTKETLNFLLLNLNLEISDEPVICEGCIHSLKEYFNSKTVRLRKSGSIVIKHESIALSDSEIYLSECGMITPETFSSSKLLCCSCKELIKPESCAHRINEEKNVTTMMEKYFPELNLNGAADYMCITCYKSLQNQLAFISKCLAVEENIKEYCKAEGTNSKGQVELRNVIHFVSKNQLQNNIYSSMNVFKTENACEGPEAEASTKVENKNFIVIEEPGISSIENEYIDIKTEQDDADRFDAQTAQENCMEQYSSSQSNIKEAAPFKCEVCGNQFKQKSSLSRHIKLHRHPSEVTMHKCKICTYQSRHRSKIKEHMLVHKDPSEVTMYKCEVCSYQNKRKYKVSAHMLSHHKDPSELTMYKCEQCAYQSRLKYRILEHMVTHKDSSEVVMHKCTLCAYQGKQRCNLRQHMLRRHRSSNVTLHKCEICAYQTKFKYKLAEHVVAHKDPSEVVMYKCDTCAYQSRTKRNLAKHIARLHGETVYKCEICAYESSLKYRLAEHMLNHKDPSEVTMYKCEKCPFQCKRKYNLATHILNRHRPPEATMYKCKECTYQCRCRRTFSEHVATHQDPSKVKTYKCKICTYQTTNKQRLSRHALIHKDPSEVVMYKCDICTYQTKHKYHLSKHLLTHRSEKKSATTNAVSQTHGRYDVVE